MLIEEFRTRNQERIDKGQQPDWTDMYILNKIDPRDIGTAITSSNYSINLVTDYLKKYKFKSWTIHKSTGKQVTDTERDDRAKESAKSLCDHSFWLSHGKGINRETLMNECKIDTIRFEDVPGLDKSCRRLWALLFWLFERTEIAKIFLSDKYVIVRNYRTNK